MTEHCTMSGFPDKRNENMHKNMKFRLSLIAAAMTASVTAMAADQPYFTVTEISGADTFPFKLARTEDQALTRTYASRAWDFYDMSPELFDIADNFSYVQGCIYYGSVCDAFWSQDGGAAYTWRKNMTDHISNVSSSFNGGGALDEFGGVYLSAGDDGSFMTGYKSSSSPDDTVNQDGHGVRYAYVWLNGTEIQLTNKGFGGAVSSLKLDDGSYLVGGYYGADDLTKSDSLYYCIGEGNYNTDTWATSDWIYNCPVFKTDAYLWHVRADGQVIDSLQLSRKDNDDARTGSVRAISKGDDGTVYAFGYVSDDEYHKGTAVARMWTVGVENGSLCVKSSSKAKGIDDPGDGDKNYLLTTFNSANSSYATGFVRYIKDKELNLPIESFIYDFRNGSVKKTIADTPFRGASIIVNSINSAGIACGQHDLSTETSPVNGGSQRTKAGFVYSVDSDSMYDLNDYICSSSGCEQGGRYYFISDAVDINDNGTILATAYRYDSKDDWVNHRNSTVVPVFLQNGSFNTDKSISSDYKVDYASSRVDSGEKDQNGADSSGGGGGGSMTPAFLAVLGGLLALRRRFHL